MKNLDYLIEKYENAPLYIKSSEIKALANKKGRIKKEKATDLSVKKLLYATDKELQNIYKKYEGGYSGAYYTGPEIPLKIRYAREIEYNRIVNDSKKISLSNPPIFYKLSRNLCESAYIGKFIDERKELKGYKKENDFGIKPEPIFAIVNRANKQGINEINKFLSKIPSGEKVELIFKGPLPGDSIGVGMAKRAIKKSKIISIDDIDQKNIISIIVKVHSMQRGHYSFIIEKNGTIKAENYYDYKYF